MKKAFISNNILYVIPSFVPAWSYGGPVKVSFDFAKELVKMGQKVTVVTTDVLDSKSRNIKYYEEIEGIKIYRFKNLNNSIARNYNFYTPIGFKNWLKKNVKDYDVVHIHELFTYQTLIASWICKKNKIPFIIQPHGSLSRVCRKTRFYYIKSLILKLFKPLIKSSSAIIALNKRERDDICEIYPQAKVIIAPNGIDLDEFRNVKKINLHKYYKIPINNKIIAFIGRINFKKGLDISLEALYKIKNKVKFTLLIIGPDEGEKRNLEILVKKLKLENNVIFTGLLSGIHKLETLKSADISLLNSRSEGLPTTLLESAALGLPIICSKESNLPEIDKFNAGYIVHSAEETAQKIRLILEDENLQKKLSQNTLDLADNFNLKKCSQLLDELYRSII